MSEAQMKELKCLIQQYGDAREELGGVESSFYWNSVNAKVEEAEAAMYAFLATLNLRK